MEMEFNPIALVLGIVGAGIAWYMAGTMAAGLILQAISAGVTGFACYMIGLVQANK